MQSALTQIRKFHEHEVEWQKRGSIAIIIRIPGYSRPSLDEYIADIGDHQGEILFIKRAVSKRDRWSGHIAIPGGRREPDETDLEAAVRETREEVGIDLEKDGFYVGPLDQRLLRVSWGRRIALALCPFVFVLNNYDAPLHPQWTEVATAFWYPVEQLLDRKSQTVELAPVGDRLEIKYLPKFLTRFVQWQVGNMRFAAINLLPSQLELPSDPSLAPPAPPYKLWGVTLGVLTDLFEVLEPGFFRSETWLPTMNAWDMRLLVFLQSYHTTKGKTQQLAEVVVDGMQTGQMDLVNKLLSGHFKYLPRAIIGGLVLRLLLAIYVLRRATKALRG